MLFFIAKEAAQKGLENGYFNTSYVIFYPMVPHQSPLKFHNFNTSYVIFYQRRMWCKCWVYRFQYILCYFLSPWVWNPIRFVSPFQYILCYFLSCPARGRLQCAAISIHPMLFFIKEGEITYTIRAEFQYILCYFLSSIF